MPGDIVRLRLGEIIPADVKLVEGEYLLTDESAGLFYQIGFYEHLLIGLHTV